jgi:hypothetical protein
MKDSYTNKVGLAPADTAARSSVAVFSELMLTPRFSATSLTVLLPCRTISTAWRLKASSYLLATAFNDKVLSIPGHSVAPKISVRQNGGTSLGDGGVGYRDALFVDGLYGSGCKEIVPFNGSNSGSL